MSLAGISCFVTLDSVKKQNISICGVLFLGGNSAARCWRAFTGFVNALSRYFIREFYFTAVTWVSQTEISVVWMNRAQNYSLVSICKNPLWMCQEVSIQNTLISTLVLIRNINY